MSYRDAYNNLCKTASILEKIAMNNSPATLYLNDLLRARADMMGFHSAPSIPLGAGAEAEGVAKEVAKSGLLKSLLDKAKGGLGLVTKHPYISGGAALGTVGTGLGLSALLKRRSVPAGLNPMTKALIGAGLLGAAGLGAYSAYND